jgi:hypothetical protein
MSIVIEVAIRDDIPAGDAGVVHEKAARKRRTVELEIVDLAAVLDNDIVVLCKR